MEGRKPLLLGCASALAIGLPVEAGGGAQAGSSPVLDSTLFEQLVVVVTAFGVKPFYMLLSLVLIVLLRRARSLDLTLVRWSLVAFLLGEIFCAANWILARGSSDAMEIAHQLGMVAFGTLLPWGIFHMLDERVLRFSDPAGPCAGRRVCPRCWKKEDAACPAHRLFCVLAPMFALLALMPLAAPVEPMDVIIPVFGTDVSHRVDFLLMTVVFRVYPFAAAALYLVAFVLLLGGKEGLRRARLPFFLGTGFLSFSMLRFFLVLAYRERPLWADAFEEITELFTLLALAALLYLLREPLGLMRPRAAEVGS